MNPLLIAGLAYGVYYYYTLYAESGPLVPGQPSFTVYWSNKCIHCLRFMPSYRNLGKIVGQIVIRHVEASNNKEFEVTAYPTMIYRDGNGNMEEYRGQRTITEISRYLKSK